MFFPLVAKVCLAPIMLVRKRFSSTAYQRRCRLYCVGTPKSGTHSIAHMFAPDIRCRHEPGRKRLVRKIMAHAGGQVTDAQLKAWIRSRDRKLNLDVDSSTLNYFIMHHLAGEFADARFLLTIRDCYSWLNSIANHGLRRASPDKHWIEFRDFRFHPELKHAPEEKAFREKGLYTIEGYLSYWVQHNEEALARVPAERLLVVRTDQITEKAYEIAEFAGLTRESIRPESTHSCKNPVKRDILRDIDRNFLEARVEKLCRPLMQKYFPEITSLEKARL